MKLVPARATQQLDFPLANGPLAMSGHARSLDSCADDRPGRSGEQQCRIQRRRL